LDLPKLVLGFQLFMSCYCLLFFKSDSYYVNMMCRPWLLRWLQKLV
jgi:hypothetical protein